MRSTRSVRSAPKAARSSGPGTRGITSCRTSIHRRPQLRRPVLASGAHRHQRGPQPGSSHRGGGRGGAGGDGGTGLPRRRPGRTERYGRRGRRRGGPGGGCAEGAHRGRRLDALERHRLQRRAGPDRDQRAALRRGLDHRPTRPPPRRPPVRRGAGTARAATCSTAGATRTRTARGRGRNATSWGSTTCSGFPKGISAPGT